jgi:hypothetical protein
MKNIKAPAFPHENRLLVLASRINEFNPQISIEALDCLCNDLDIRGHLAILQNPYTDKIINGEKTIESRFTKVKTILFNNIKANDILILKVAGGPIKAVTEIKYTQFFGPLAPGKAALIMDKYKNELALEDDFKTIKFNSLYATLVHIGAIVSIEPICLQKKDRRAWIILGSKKNNDTQLSLSFR